ncbi:hypothetical protein ASG76_00735 [Nocardioides sp. Soil774]|uniref:DUF4012 domain-containing protein n=1 Tax=Nocardioides sp. Soil774 TaxID=1736408 RepID=UPI000701E7F3|nr:DUF4012 domain-containing protein [Nocardioides sp. Soil774]KRE97290.1 hypothetical protein ASG76_00735 [Nocardioides sp. Soil774]
MGKSRRSSSTRPWQRPLLLVGGLILLVVVLGLLALPFRKAPAAAESAKADLEAAKAALTSQDFKRARKHVTNARLHTDEVQDAMQGIGGDVWSMIPVIGRPVADVRHMGNALDELTSVAEVGVKTWPLVDGKKAKLFRDGSVDIPTLTTVVEAVSDATSSLDTARTELGEVHDSALGIGTRVADARDEAAAVVSPLASDAERFEPLADALPSLLAAGEEKKYLLALLNPSEQRFSGGAPLTMSVLTMTDGKVTVGEAQDATDPYLYRVGRWPKVEGNPFHTGKLRLSTSTFAPEWSVSGEELLRGWSRKRDQEMDGLIAVDVVALGNLLDITGPVEVPYYGTLDSAAFVEKLIGDYDSFSSNEERKQLNRAMIPIFTDRVLGPGDSLAKVMSLRDSARARHFAIWMRDPQVQAPLADIGLAGELSDTNHDYVAVFNQNTNVSKSDYWQKRVVTSDVQLREDGSARVRMTISVHNDSPPYLQPFADPQGGTYFTRWNGMTLGVFLPHGVEIRSASAAGKALGTDTFDYYGRPYKLLRLVLPPGETREAVLEYVVPAAAVPGDDGTLTYRLDATPQGMVVPQALKVSVQWPAGYDVSDLPEGWTRTGRGQASYDDPGLVTQPSFSITGSAVGAAAP